MLETTVRTNGGLRADATTRGLTTPMDEPAENGGTGVAMSPQETLLASLGGCTAMTLKLYSARKQWPLEDVEIRVTMEPAPRDQPDAPTRFTQEVRLIGDLDDAQRERLHQIAGRCPVHRILEGPIAIDERLEEGVR